MFVGQTARNAFYSGPGGKVFGCLQYFQPQITKRKWFREGLAFVNDADQVFADFAAIQLCIIVRSSYSLIRI